jgi:hypothetical protein
MGSIAGGGIGQIVGAQMGGMSKVLLHSETFCPFVHRQTQLAFACDSGKRETNQAATTMAAILMA